MQLTFRGHSFVILGVAGTSLTITVPAGFVTNDILWAFISTDDTNVANFGDATIPTGWTLLANDAPGGLSLAIMKTYWFLPGSPPAASYTWVMNESHVWFGAIGIWGPALAPTIKTAVGANFAPPPCPAPGSVQPFVNTASLATDDTGDTMLFCNNDSYAQCPPLEGPSPTSGQVVDFILQTTWWIGRFPHASFVADPKQTWVFAGTPPNAHDWIVRGAYQPVGVSPPISTTGRRMRTGGFAGGLYLTDFELSLYDEEEGQG